MRLESSVTSVSWIPSEAIRGLTRMPFDLGVGHYDEPPPEVLGDLADLHAAGAFRFANRLRAWVEVEDGRITAYDRMGRSYLSTTLMSLAGVRVAFLPTAFPDLLPEPEVSATSVRFVQTAGGRPGVPAPRRVRDKPFVQWLGPTVWTTLALTIKADGTSHGELVGASTFPRHWLYDAEDTLVGKSGLIDFHGWYRNTFGEHSPWGGEESPAFVVMAESALERQLATTIMRGGARPRRRRLTVGETLVEQGRPGSELYLLLDGVLAVEVDGEHLADVGPGAVVGERAVLEGGRRTATLRASTPCHVAVAASSDVDPDALADLVAGHRREER